MDSSRISWQKRVAALLMATAVTLGLATVPSAVAAPNNKEKRIAQLESQIAQNRVKTEAAELAYAQSAEAYAGAVEELNIAKEKAQDASQKAAKARNDSIQAKKKLGQLAITMYRQDSVGFTGMEAVTESHAFRTQSIKKVAGDILSSQADQQVQQLSALDNVSQVMQQVANQAVTEKNAAAENLAATERSARAAAQKATQELQAAKSEHDRIVAELAHEREVTLAQEKARQAAAAAAAARRAEQAAASRPQNPAAPSTPGRPPARPPYQPPTGGQAAQGQGGALLNWALSKRGYPYIWGGVGPRGYDCSGIIYAGMLQMGRRIPRVASGQYIGLQKVPFSQKRPGDLIFFSSNGTASGIYHVGIYYGGEQILHAPRPGDVVKIAPFYNRHRMMPYVARL